MKIYCLLTRRLLLLFLIAMVPALLLAQTIKRPPITGIAFVKLQVSDIKKAEVFYHSLMGYTMQPVVSGNTKNKLATISVNFRQSIELEDGLPAGQDERLMGLAFQTTDAEAMRLYLQSKSIVVPGVITRQPGRAFFTVKDPDGHPITFIACDPNVKKQTKNIETPAISQRILHAGLTIANAQAANSFYGDILGFSEIWRGGANDSITSWINMRVPEGTDYLEYMLVTGPVNRQQLGSMHHIALMVPDMQHAADILAERQAATHYTVAAPRIGRNNRWQLNLFDPDGTRIELMEPFTMR